MSIFRMSLTAGALIIAIVIIRSLALNKLPKSFFLVLWGIAACRLLIPFEMPSSFSIFNSFNKAITVLQPIAETSTIQGVINYNIINAMPQVIPSLGKTISISPLQIIWLIGVVSITIIFAIAYYKNYAELITALPIKDNPMLEQWHSKQNLLRPLNILVSDKVTTPIAFGIMKPRIILPKSMNLNDMQLVQFVLAHELQHIKHLDMFWKIILMVVVCLHWFNPLVWVMYVLVNRDLELSCDEKVVRQFGEVTKSAYALSLISMAEQRSKFTPLYNGFSKNAAEERIVSIMRFKKTSTIAVVFSAILIIGTTTAFATSAISKNDNSYSTNGIAANDEKSKLSTEQHYASYIKFGLTYDKSNELFYYEGNLVRTFSDKATESGMYYNYFSQNGGTVDLQVIRDDKKEITGIVTASKEDYDQMTAKIERSQKEMEQYLKNLPEIDSNSSLSYSLGDIEDGTNTPIQEMTENTNPLSSVSSDTAQSYNGSYVDDTLNDYTDNGVSYDRASRTWMYGNKAICFLSDINHQTFVNFPLNDTDNNYTDEVEKSNGVFLKVSRKSNGTIDKITEMTVEEAVKEIKAEFN